MKYLYVILIMLLSQSIAGQSVDNFSYHAVHVPSSVINNISIDGNINEWSWVPQQYMMKNRDFFNGTEVAPNDFTIESFVAWSSLTDKIYIVAKVVDDIVSVDRLDDDDELEVKVNPFNINGELWPGSSFKVAFLNVFYFIINPKSTLEDASLSYGSHWNFNKDYLNFNIFSEKKNEKSNTTYYEIELNLWEYYSLYSSKLSKPLKLEANSRIGLTMAFNDVDKNTNKRDIQLRTFSGYFYDHRAEFCSFFVLDPPKLFTTIYDDLLFFNKP